MPLEPCQPCNCISGNISNDKFKQDVEVILCAILSAAVAPVSTVISPAEMVTIEFGDITNAYLNTGLTNAPWTGLHFNNNTDGTLLFVFANASNAANLRLVGNETRSLNFSPKVIGGNLYVKWEVAPTMGNLYIEAWSG